jgi:TetR/AcrR family transcriptional repressor of nem operon
MRRSREEAAETRRKIVDKASQLFRARGIDAVSVADVMGALGMTVGGFYRHFESKEALVGEAIEAASLASSTDPAVGAEAMLRAYLSDAHRRQVARGCPVAALCSEVGHQGRGTKKAFTGAMDRLVATVEAVMPGASRKEVLHTAAAVVGGLVLARATTDDQLASELLEAVTDETLAALKSG